MQVRKQQLELDMEQQTGSKIGQGVYKGCILSPCLFNLYAMYIMWDARLDEAQTGSKIAREISITSDMQMTPPLWLKAKNIGLKLNIQKTMIMASGPITDWQIGGKTVERVTDFILGGLQNHCRLWLQSWN